MSKAEKQAEIEKRLNEDVQNFINSREQKPYTEGWSEENWENEMQKHPLFMTSCPNQSYEISPLLEALQQLKYDPAENTAEELANSYKDDGNENFRMKKYRWAIDSYTTGLKQNCKNPEVNAILFTNRAAAHFRIGNYRSALRDVTEARKLKPKHKKALLRGAQCCKELGEYQECIFWCDEILSLESENQYATDLKKQMLLQQTIQERDHRKWLAEDRKNKSTQGALKIALQERSIRFYTKHLDDDIEDAQLDMLSSIHPAAADYKVFMNEFNHLIWPVIFVYPEYSETDFIQEFNENDSFQEHLNVMFTGTSKPSWDERSIYNPDTITIYFEDCETKEFVWVSKSSALQKVLSHERFQIVGGNPTFILISKESGFHETFIKEHKMIDF